MGSGGGVGVRVQRWGAGGGRGEGVGQIRGRILTSVGCKCLGTYVGFNWYESQIISGHFI